MAEARGPRYGRMEEAIINAAGELFDIKGFNQTSLADIAESLGVARPSLYHYFNGREQILAAGVDRLTEQRNQLIEELRGVPGDPTERLTTIVTTFGRFVVDNPAWIRVVLRDGPALPAEASERDTASRMDFFRLLVEVIHDGIEQGHVRPVDEEAAALSIVSALSSLNWQYVANLKESPRDFTKSTADLLLHGILCVDRRGGSPLERGLDLIREGAALIDRHKRGLPD
jgi:AcrR family transcriptional regulator